MSVDKLNISDFLLNFFGSTKAKETWESDESIFDNIGNGNDYSEYDAVSIGKELLELQEKLNTTNDKKSRQAIQKAIQERKQNQRESIIKDEVAQFLSNTGLSADVAAELVSLTLKYAESLNMVDRNTLSQKIKDFAEQNHINKEELEKTEALKNTVDGFTLEDIQDERQLINSEYENKMANLTADLSSITDPAIIEQKHAEMEVLHVENHTKNMKLAKDQYMLETELPPNIASELFILTTKKKFS